MSLHLSAAIDGHKDKPADVEHKTIEIKKINGQVTIIDVEADGEMHVIELTDEEIADKQVLKSKLSVLDETTRKEVMRALHNKPMHADKKMKIIKKHKHDHNKMLQDSEHEVEVYVEKDENGNTHKRKIMIVEDYEHDADGMKSKHKHKMKMKGNYKTIIKLIEKGDFSQSELEEIKAALDAKS